MNFALFLSLPALFATPISSFRMNTYRSVSKQSTSTPLESTHTQNWGDGPQRLTTRRLSRRGLAKADRAGAFAKAGHCSYIVWRYNEPPRQPILRKRPSNGRNEREHSTRRPAEFLLSLCPRRAPATCKTLETKEPSSIKTVNQEGSTELCVAEPCSETFDPGDRSVREMQMEPKRRT